MVVTGTQPSPPEETLRRAHGFSTVWSAPPWGRLRRLQLALWAVYVLLLPVVPPAGHALLDVVVYPVVVAVGALTCVLTARRGQVGAERTGWWLLGLAVLSTAGGGLYPLGAASQNPQPSTVRALLFFAFYPLCYAAVWFLMRARTPRWLPSQWGDGAVVALGAVAVFGLLVDLLAPPGELRSWPQLVALAYPVAGLVLTALVFWVAAASGRRGGATFWWLGGGVALVALADLLLLVRADPGGRDDLLLDVLWLTGTVVATTATVGGQGVVTRERRLVRPSRLRRTVLPTAAVVLSLLVLAGRVTTRAVTEAAAIAALACLVAALGRLALLAWRRGEEAGPLGLRPGADETDPNTDTVTGLANRQALSAALAGESAARAVQPVAEAMALLLVDLDRFKEVNEALGHDAGDRLLAEVGTRLHTVLRPPQLLARLGGDEFAVVLPGADDAAAVRVATALRGALEEPFAVDGERVHVRASIGVATRLRAGGPAEDLLRRADVAMYRAKGTAGGVEVFDPALDHAGPARLRRIDELTSALQRGELEVHLQPQVDLSSGELVGCEALARWRHPSDGVLLPAAFLPLAGQTGLMRPVTRLVVDAALDACATWWRRGHEQVVSVNLSADDLADDDVRNHVEEALRARDLPGRALRIEITEDQLVRDPSGASRWLQRWRDTGVGVAIDDYGTGYSSLAYLKELPVDEVKLDRVFAGDIGRRATTTIVRHTVAMAHGLGLRVVAEGMEDAASARALAELGCDVGQGNYFGEPMTVERFLARLT